MARRWVGGIAAAIALVAVAGLVYLPKYGRAYRVRRWLRGDHGATVAATRDLPAAIAAADGELFWFDVEEGRPPTLGRVPAAGGAARAVVVDAASATLHADAAHVVWGERPPFFVMTRSDGRVVRVGEPWPAPSKGSTPYAVPAMDATTLYWAANDSGELVRAPIDGGAQTTVATGLDDPRALVVDGGDAFVGENKAGVVRVDLATGAKTTLDAVPMTSSGLVTDATFVYYVAAPAPGAGELRRVAKHGGAPETLAPCDPLAWYLARAGGALVWFEGSTHRVRAARADKPGPVGTLDTPLEYPQLLAADGANVFVADWYEIARVTPRAR